MITGRAAFWIQFERMVFNKNWFLKIILRFADIEEYLHPRDKAHMVMVYDLFNVLLDSDC